VTGGCIVYSYLKNVHEARDASRAPLTFTFGAVPSGVVVGILRRCGRWYLQVSLIVKKLLVKPRNVKKKENAHLALGARALLISDPGVLIVVVVGNDCCRRFGRGDLCRHCALRKVL
jgi:hypothetical protein